MSFIDEARGKLTETRNELKKSWSGTDDTKDRENIDDAITEISKNLGSLDRSDWLGAADAVVDATVALERLVSRARFLLSSESGKRLEAMVNSIANLLRNGDLMEHLERTPEIFSEPASSDDSTPEPEASSEKAVSPSPTQAVCSTRDFSVLAAEYGDWFAAMVLREDISKKSIGM